MKRIILFTGIYDLFGLQLADALAVKRPSSICFFSTKENVELLYQMIERLKSAAKKQYYSACLKKIVCLDETQEEPVPELCSAAIELWHLDPFYPAVSTYHREALKHNEEIIHSIKRLCSNYLVQEIHYLSSIYAFADGSANVFLKIKEINEAYIQDICKGHSLKGKIYRIPVLYQQTGQEGEDDFLHRLRKQISDFVKWVKGRIPNYFDNYQVRLLKKNDGYLHRLDLAQVIEKIIELEAAASEDLVERYHICAAQRDAVVIVKKKLLEQLFHIDVCVAEADFELSAIDRILDQIDSFHLPSLIEKTDEAKRVILNVPELGQFEPKAGEPKEAAISNKQAKILAVEGGKQLTYYTAGSGPAILIVNAYGVDEKAWNLLVERLAQNYYLIYWRSRGLYHDEKRNGRQDLSCGILDQVEDIERIAAKEQLSMFHLMSWCSGAKAAIYYYLKHPQQILSQIFIAGEFAPFTGSEPFHSKFRENIQLIADIIQNDDKMLDFYMKIIHKGMFNHPVKEFSSADAMYIFEIMPAKHRDILLSPFASKETMVNFLRMCMEYYQHDVTEKLEALRVPVLFIAAQCDQVAPYQQSEWAHAHVKDSAYVCFPAGTHLLILERTLDVYEIIKQHMKYHSL